LDLSGIKTTKGRKVSSALTKFWNMRITTIPKK
jgi:hypothetical protein